MSICEPRGGGSLMRQRACGRLEALPRDDCAREDAPLAPLRHTNSGGSGSPTAGAARRAASCASTPPDSVASILTTDMLAAGGHSKHGSLPTLDAMSPAQFAKGRPPTSNPTLDSLILGGGSRGVLAAKRRTSNHTHTASDTASKCSVPHLHDTATTSSQGASDATTVWWLQDGSFSPTARDKGKRPQTSNPARDMKDALRTWVDADDFCKPDGQGERRQFDAVQSAEESAARWLSNEDSGDEGNARALRPCTANPTRDMEDALRGWIDTKHPSLRELRESSRMRPNEIKSDVWTMGVERPSSPAVPLPSDFRPRTSNPMRDMEDAMRGMCTEIPQKQQQLLQQPARPAADAGAAAVNDVPRSLVWKLHPFTDGLAGTQQVQVRSSVDSSVGESEMSTLNLMSEASQLSTLESFHTVLTAAGVTSEKGSLPSRMRRKIMAPAALDIDMITAGGRPGTSNPVRDRADARGPHAQEVVAGAGAAAAVSSSVWNLTSPSTAAANPAEPWKVLERPTTANPGRDIADAMRTWANEVLTPDVSSAGTSENVSPQPGSATSERQCDVWRRCELSAVET